jgi:hypothetical protein
MYEELHSMDCSPDIVRVMNEGGWAGLKVLIDKRDAKILHQSFVFSSSYIDMSKIDSIELDGIGFFSTWPCGICRPVINVLSPELIDMSSWRRLIPNWGVSRGSPLLHLFRVSYRDSGRYCLSVGLTMKVGSSVNLSI